MPPRIRRNRPRVAGTRFVSPLVGCRIYSRNAHLRLQRGGPDSPENRLNGTHPCRRKQSQTTLRCRASEQCRPRARGRTSGVAHSLQGTPQRRTSHRTSPSLDLDFDETSTHALSCVPPSSHRHVAMRLHPSRTSQRSPPTRKGQPPQSWGGAPVAVEGSGALATARLCKPECGSHAGTELVLQ